MPSHPISRRTVLGAAFALLCAGCALKNSYSTPPGLSPQTGATVTSNSIPATNSVYGEAKMRISWVDGRIVYPSPEHDVLLLAPGGHTLQIIVRQESALLAAVGYEVALHADLAAGRRYTIRLDKPKEETQPLLWIEDVDSHAPVSDKTKVSDGLHGMPWR